MQEKQKLEKLNKSANRTLFRASTVFPFVVFADQIVIDQEKVDIVYGRFFMSSKVFTMLIQDIRTVKVVTGPLFATLKFEIKNYEQNPEPLRYLWKDDALAARSTIMGLISAHGEDIDLLQIDRQTVKEQTRRIGNAQVEVS